MPFEKGRQKTGGRQKGGSARKSTKFVDQLKNFNFNYPKELSEVLLTLKRLRTELGEFKPSGNKDADNLELARRKIIFDELKFFYGEIKSLLPYMAPKLREKEVEVVEPTDDVPTESAITTEDLLKAFDEKPATETKPRPSNPNPVGAGSAELQVSVRPEEDLSNLAGEQEEDS